MPSSLAAIMVAAVPLIGAVLAMRFDHSERPRRSARSGLLIGFSGVVALVGIDVAGHRGELLGIGAIMLTATGYAIGPMLIKHRLGRTGSPRQHRRRPGARLAPAAARGRARSARTGCRAPARSASVVVLGLLCTAVGFVVFAILIGEAGTSRATVITYVNPVVAVTLGVLLLGEQPGAGAVAGLLLILAGGWLSTDGRLPPGVARLGARVPRRTGRTSPAVNRS